MFDWFSRNEMTSPVSIPERPPAALAYAQSPPPAESSEGLDIKKVLSGSTSDISVSELSQKGFKKVKVLNQAVIQKLIIEAVDQVIARRSKKISSDEREKVIQESKSHFEDLAKDRLQREKDRISELERANESLLRETEELRRRLLEKDEECSRLKAKPAAEERGFSDRLVEAIMARLPVPAPGAGAAAGAITELQKSLQAIAAKIDKLPGRGPAGSTMPVDEEALLEVLFRTDNTAPADTNVQQIKIKETKASGVKGTLAKLKALQKGGKDGD